MCDMLVKVARTYIRALFFSTFGFPISVGWRFCIPLEEDRETYRKQFSKIRCITAQKFRSKKNFALGTEMTTVLKYPLKSILHQINTRISFLSDQFFIDVFNL